MANYSHAPPLHPGLLAGSLQVFGWLFFHPSAWCHHVARLDPPLRPDFSLVDLHRAHWRQPEVRRLLAMLYLVWPLSLALLTGVTLWLLGPAPRDAAAGLALGMTLAIMFALWVGVASSVAVGAAGGLVGGLVTAIVVAGAFAVARSSGSSAPSFASGAVFGVAAGLSLGALNGVAGGIGVGVVPADRADAGLRQVGSVGLGVGVSLLLGIATYGIASSAASSLPVGFTFSIAFAVVDGALVSAIFALCAGWRAASWRLGLLVGGAVVALCLVFGVVAGISYARGGAVPSGVGYDAGTGFVAGVESAAMFTLAYLVVGRLAGSRAGAIAGALGGAEFFAILLVVDRGYSVWPALPLWLGSIVLGLTLPRWLPLVLHPALLAWDALLLRADEQRGPAAPSLLRFNSAFWCEYQTLPIVGLDAHLVILAERDAAAGQAAIEHIAAGPQAWAARAAQIELDALQLARCLDVAAIRRAHRRLGAGELAGPASALLRSLSRISQDVDAALRQTSPYHRRLALTACEERLDGLLRELVRSDERYAARFQPIVAQWRSALASHVRELVATVELRGEIDSPYVVGVPLTAEGDVFVGRVDVCARIERLIRDRRGPPLLLYGQRRMGKTSLLNNLGRLLPSTIVPLFVDLQAPAAQAADDAGFLYNLARGITRSAAVQRRLTLPSLTREELIGDPFTRFDEWLDAVERALGASAALLALDEFEALDAALADNRFQATAVLALLRHLIQHRPRFKVMLAGSHTLDELERWSSYLINARVVPIGYLSEAESLQLIEHPVENFALTYDPAASRRIFDLTRGHPCLVQLLCAEIVALKNEQPVAERWRVQVSDVETAVPRALDSGHLFFVDIQRNQVDEAALSVLKFVASRGEGVWTSREALAQSFTDNLDGCLDVLSRRDVIERSDLGYRFQVELIRRWFEQLDSDAVHP